MQKSYILLLTVAVLSFSSASGQVLNKLRQKVENTADKAIDKALDDKKKNESASASSGTSSTNTDNSGSSDRRKAQNKGGGLITTPPDVNQNLSDAETSYKSGKYGEARYAVQQAMLGVEMEIGQDIMKSLPETVSGLKKEASADKVSSNGWGWAGLTIERLYTNGDDKELTVTIANNSAWMSSVNLYLTSGAHSQTTGGEQNWKQVKVKGYRAVIEFDENSGYKLSVPIGQSSLIVYEGVNFATEQEMLAAAGAIDIDGIKKKLGEQ
jgi:type II secretory pathway pseudopilin PulG